MDVTQRAIVKARDIADDIACGCTEAETIADVEVLRSLLEAA